MFFGPLNFLHWVTFNCEIYIFYFLLQIQLIWICILRLLVLDLCCNQLTGFIPTNMGSLKKLSVLALQHNRLNGPIPASLGDLEMIKRLNLSVNQLSGFIPARLANITQLEVLDVRNNTLSGVVPPCKLFSSLLVSFDQMAYFK